jgi:CheY-like chemotaxis protein
MSKTILYLEDDDRDVALVAQAVGRLADAQLVVAKNADEFIRLAKEHLPDLFLVDICLQGQRDQGDDAVSRLSDVGGADRVPVLYFTILIRKHEETLEKDPRAEFYKGKGGCYFASKQLKRSPDELATCLRCLL